MGIGVTKIFFTILVSNLIRIFRFIPNNDPIMSFMLPFSKQEKLSVAVFFPIITMVSFDLITGFVGIWTIVTALTYGFLGAFFFFTYKKFKKIKMKHYLASGVVGVLIFDFVTGVMMMPLLFGYSFEIALIGQIPFTILHLATVSGFVLVFTPLVEKFILDNKNLEDSKVKAFFINVARA